jgi:hypothetical protein
MNQAERARLLYTLLDAIEDDGRFPGPAVAARWHALKRRFNDAQCEPECAALEALLDELDHSGALTESWIQSRWHRVKGRCPSSSAQPSKVPGRVEGRPAGDEFAQS